MPVGYKKVPNNENVLPRVRPNHYESPDFDFKACKSYHATADAFFGTL